MTLGVPKGHVLPTRANTRALLQYEADSAALIDTWASSSFFQAHLRLC
jgi:hypothetical protein